MALESRSRMVSFRLTEEEYERFRRVCMSRGLRNVSELVRAAVSQMMNDISGTPEASAVVTTDIHSRVATLEAHLAELASHFYRMETRLANDPSNLPNPVHFAQSASGQ